jgi:hypothetical protein
LDEDDKDHITIDKGLAKIGFIVALLVIASVGAYFYSKPQKSNDEATQFSNVVPANIAEVYPLFLCPCCGKPLDPENPCCGLAKERIDYISALSDSGISNDRIVLTTVKKYGIDLLINESMKNEVRKELTRLAPEDRPKISISPTSHDFGDVSVAGGTVTTTMTVENKGLTDLVIDNIETSCMCTTAALVIEDTVSPTYGMNMNDGKHPTGWIGILHISYDPTMHGEFRGPLTRTISIFSNDEIDFKLDVRIEANQID